MNISIDDLEYFFDTCHKLIYSYGLFKVENVYLHKLHIIYCLTKYIFNKGLFLKYDQNIFKTFFSIKTL